MPKMNICHFQFGSHDLSSIIHHLINKKEEGKDHNFIRHSNTTVLYYNSSNNS